MTKKQEELELDKEKKEQPQQSWKLATFVMLIGGFMAILDSSIVNVAIPSMMIDFSTTLSQIQWITTVYMLTLGVIVPTSGWLGDYLGFKKLYVYSLAIFTIGSGLCSLAWSKDILIAARVIQALGGGMIMPTMMAMIYQVVPKDRIGSAMGIFGLTMLVAPAVGPTLGGYLVEYVNWRWIFTINLPVGIIGTFLAAKALPDFARREAGRFDLLGFLTSSSGLFCLLLALSQGEDWGWTSLEVVLLLYFAVSLLAVFIYHELTTENPLLDLRVFKYPTFAIGNLMLVVITIGMFGGLFFIPYFLQVVRGLGAMEVGTLMLPPALVSAVMMPLSGKLYDKVGPKPSVALGTLIIAFSTFLFVKIDINTPLNTIVQWNMLRSIGMGLTMMPLQAAIMAVVPPDQVGRGSAITNIISRVASSLGLAVLTLMLNNRITLHSAYLTWTTSGSNFNTLLATSPTNSALVTSLLRGNIAITAFVQSLNEMFYVTSAISLLAFFPVFFLTKGTKKQEGTDLMLE